MRWKSWKSNGSRVWVGFCLCSLAATAWSREGQRYETGFSHLARLSTDLHRALEPEQKKNLALQPVLLEQMSLPYIQPSRQATRANGAASVSVSSGFIHLMNQLSHAMAIDQEQRGYLSQYLRQLNDSQPPAELQSGAQPVSWSFDVMNHQVSRFNQMAGALLAVDMAHHYLGYYNKYAGQLGPDHSLPINRCLTPAEWRLSVLHGAQNALQCGLGVEGLKFLFDCLNKMEARPEWTFYLMPAKADVRKIKRDLDRLESAFFAGERFKF